MNSNQSQARPGKAIELAEESDFSLGTLGVRPSRREIVSADRTKSVEPRVMQVLVALARRRGDVVSREYLTELCWSGRFVSEDALNRCMTKVRKLAAPDAFELETIPRVGYRLIEAQLAVTAPQPSPSSSQPAEHSAEAAPQPPAPRRRLYWALAGAAVLMVACAWIGISYFQQLNRPYFAVLPFDVVGADPRAATLAATLPTAISTQLATQGYELLAANVAASYRGERKAAVLSDIDVRYVVDGSVHVERGVVHVSARIDAGRVSVWSQEFKFEVDDSAMASEHVAVAISSLFNPGVRMIFDNPPQVTAAIMRAGALMRAGDDVGAYVATREMMRRSPTNRTYAIYHALAVGAVLDMLPAQERLRALQEGRGSTDRASKDFASGAPMSTFAVTPPVEWALRESILREGLARPYTDASGLRRLLANHLANGGRLAEALAVSEQSLRIDRSSSSNVAANAYLLDAIGRVQEADVVLARAHRLWPGNEFIERSRFSLALAREDAAAAHALLADPVSGPLLDPRANAHPLPIIVTALETRAAADIDRIEQECTDPDKLARDRARFCLQALVLFDRIDTFFELAPRYFPEQRGATPVERDARWIADPRALANVRVLFRNDARELREDERFIAIVERLGLIDYWRTTGIWPDFCNDEPSSVCKKMRLDSQQ